MKNGAASAASYASSFTSVDEDDDAPRKPSSGARGRQTRPARPIRSDSGDAAAGSWAGDGYAVWSRVATAASELTVNVSKAWATNIATYTGEETPPGQESRLTRAMKAYHLEKARSPQDLPTWLFDEKERRPKAADPPKSRPSRRYTDDDDDLEEVQVKRAEVQRPRGLRDIYDSAASESVKSTRPAERAVGRSYGEEPGISSARGTDRLKALRAARKNAQTEQESRYDYEEPQPQSDRRRVG